LPEAFGCWNFICKRFNAWSSSSKWGRIFKVLSIDSDWEWEFIDGSDVKAHQHSAGTAHEEPWRSEKAVRAIPQIREQIMKKGVQAVMPRKLNSLKGNADMDWSLYRYRHWLENAFARLKQYRAVGYDTTS